ncbi:MAG: hypothetical protein ACOY71_00755 [Gemmatimonadota bacterium]
MSCCGKARAAARAAAGGGSPPLGPAEPPAKTPVIVFEYEGQGPVTLVGPATGTRYRFSGAGDRVRIDPRDRPGLAKMAHLRWIR